jgi:hypothetical protein
MGNYQRADMNNSECLQISPVSCPGKDHSDDIPIPSCVSLRFETNSVIIILYEKD